MAHERLEMIENEPKLTRAARDMRAFRDRETAAGKVKLHNYITPAQRDAFRAVLDGRAKVVYSEHQGNTQ